MAVLPRRRYTPEEYLDLERAAEYRSEYFAGEIFAMAGASREHILIVANLTRELGTQLRGRQCETYPNDMRVKVTESGLYTYPDVAVVCGDPLFEDEEVDTLLNPTVLIEVLSPTTEAYDRGKKFGHYRRLDSLQEYVLIAQDQPRIERYRRQQDQQWLLTETSGLTETVHLEAIDCHLALAEVYDRVRFPDEAEAGADA
jgi:Uma2 family endonuclease